MFARLSSAFVGLLLVTSAVVASNDVCKKVCCDHVEGLVSRGVVYYCAMLTFARPGPDSLDRGGMSSHRGLWRAVSPPHEAVVLQSCCASRYLPLSMLAMTLSDL